MGLAEHIIVDAKAGTGKTTTLVEGLNLLRDKGYSPPFVPSDQQSFIWDNLLEGDYPNTVLFCSFSKSIANHLQELVPNDCEASTLHSEGYKITRRWLNVGRLRADGWKTKNLIALILEKDIYELFKHQRELVSATEALVEMCKLRLIGWNDDMNFPASTIDWDSIQEQLPDLVQHYDITTNGYEDDVFALVPKVLRFSADLGDGERLAGDGYKKIDFADMLWLPIIHKARFNKRDLLLVDEAQDLNPCQQAFAMKCGKRIVVVGDPRQAIYGFAGADTDSMETMKAMLDNTERGSITLELNTTYRCGKKIVAEAQKIVQDYYAYEENPDGEVLKITKEKMMSTLEDDDFVVCRTNAPLVGTAFRLIAGGQKATIVGGNIGKGLIALINSMKAADVPDLMDRIEEHTLKQIEKASKSKIPSDDKIIAVMDKRDCIMVFCEECFSVSDVIKSIESMFEDKVNEGVRLSSVHRAKGLEADRVFLLHPDLMPHPMAKTEEAREQEMNLKYVAITRAISTLYFVLGE